MRNLLQLQKQYITCILNGANLSIVRGEKIPVVLMDHDKANAYTRSGKSIQLSDILYETESGWYIIDGIEWVFDPYNANSLGTAWTTHVNLTKREWPIPGVTDQKFYEKDLVVVETGNGDTVVLGYQDAVAKYGRDHVKRGYDPELDMNDSSVIQLDPLEVVYPTKNGINSDVEIDLDDIKQSLDDVVEEPKSNTNDNTTNIPLTGLKDYMKQCYQLIASKVNIKLVGAKRWAVNEEGMKVEGNAFVKNHGYYKCVNTMNEILYFKQSNSKHLYGEAIDIINVEGSTDFNRIMTDVIMKDPDILSHMYNNGLSAYIEQGEDDNGVITKHYHIGTDTIKQKEFWNSVKAINKSTIIPGTYIDFQDYLSKNKTTIEITRNPVNEVTTT